MASRYFLTIVRHAFYAQNFYGCKGSKFTSTVSISTAVAVPKSTYIRPLLGLHDP